ncbi:hypothetical protein CEXT_28171 [Caerostris extrusa]|uniref:Uncharacterized protein n=1 Tax=Caerostris extrusa TaxID=172846 RepID=A0AAV4XLM0_CAEEX|nr:hypothetical protein CEXT_28171 [Caerostris extrusa]
MNSQTKINNDDVLLKKLDIKNDSSTIGKNSLNTTIDTTELGISSSVLSKSSSQTLPSKKNDKPLAEAIVSNKRVNKTLLSPKKLKNSSLSAEKNLRKTIC